MSGLVKRKFFNRFTADGTYTIPNGVNMVWIECIGAGGSGGGDTGHTTGGAGGGGGGAYSYQVFDAKALSSTLAVVIGAGGSAQTGQGDEGDPSSVALIGNNAAGVDSGKLLLKGWNGGRGGYGAHDGGVGPLAHPLGGVLRRGEGSLFGQHNGFLGLARGARLRRVGDGRGVRPAGDTGAPGQGQRCQCGGGQHGAREVVADHRIILPSEVAILRVRRAR